MGAGLEAVLGEAGGHEKHGGGGREWGRAWPGHVTPRGMFMGKGETDRRGLLRSGCLVRGRTSRGPCGPRV